MRVASLFDLDRTLVRANTAPLYVRWQFRNGEAGHRDVAKMLWWLGQYALGLLDADALSREAALGLAGRPEEPFRQRLRAWVEQEVLPLVSPQARSEVDRARRDGRVMAIVTSSTPYSAEPIAASLGIDHVLASRLEVREGHFTGRCLQPLCYGAGKVTLAEAWALAHDVDLRASSFYSDSISDLPLLAHVADPIVVNPDPRLRWLAHRRGWRTERW